MKLLGVRMARSIWLVPHYFLNPKGLFLRPAAVQLKERYQFLKGPFDNNTVGTQEVKYEHGAFTDRDGRLIAIIGVSLHPDGLVVDTQSSTDACDAFVEDMAKWLSEEYGLPSFTDLPIKRDYASELNVEMTNVEAIANPRMRKFLNSVAQTISDAVPPKVGFLTFQVTTDPAKSPRPAIFRIDREINTSLEDNRYYSYAPVTTSEHIRLLEELEAAL